MSNNVYKVVNKKTGAVRFNVRCTVNGKVTNFGSYVTEAEADARANNVRAAMKARGMQNTTRNNVKDKSIDEILDGLMGGAA